MDELELKKLWMEETREVTLETLPAFLQKLCIVSPALVQKRWRGLVSPPPYLFEGRARMSRNS